MFFCFFEEKKGAKAFNRIVARRDREGRRHGQGCNLGGRYRIDRKVGFTVKVFGQFFGRFVLLIKRRVILQRGGCGCFVLVNK